MNHTTQRLLDKLVTKTSIALKKRKPPKLTPHEIDFMDDIQRTIPPLMEKLVSSPNQSLQQEACFILLSDALIQLRCYLERNEAWAQRLYQKVDCFFGEHLLKCSRESVMGVVGAFYEARLALPALIKESSTQALSGDPHEALSPEEFHAMGQHMVDSFFEEEEHVTAFALSALLFQPLQTMPPEAIDAMLESLMNSHRPIAQDAAVLFLLHPDEAIRMQTLRLLNEAFVTHAPTPDSLRRLIVIRQWWPMAQRQSLDQLIAEQRKRGLPFADNKPAPSSIRYYASLFDGSGVQMIFIETQHGGTSRAAGFSIKYGIGIRDVWLSPTEATEKEMRALRKNVHEESKLCLSEVSEEYVARITSHYIATNNSSRGETPELTLLELYEHLDACEWRSEFSTLDACLSALVSEAAPEGMSPEWIRLSLERGMAWMEREPYTKSWFETRQDIDALINRHTSIQRGKKKTNIAEAIHELHETGFESVRQKWMEQFVWMALMTKSQPAIKNQELWKDFTTLAYVLQQGWPMRKIPMMHRMIHDSLYISMESMAERAGHLH